MAILKIIQNNYTVYYFDQKTSWRKLKNTKPEENTYSSAVLEILSDWPITIDLGYLSNTPVLKEKSLQHLNIRNVTHNQIDLL